MELVAQYAPQILSFAGIYIFIVISPGPDFAVVVRNSLIYSRKTGLFTALGVTIAAFFHLSYALLGLGFVITESVIIFSIIKYSGVGYLFYLGCKGLMAKRASVALGNTKHAKDISAFKAFVSGFVVNALNPKALLFYLSIFSLMIPPEAPPFIVGLYVLTIFMIKICWFSFVALCLSAKRTREKFLGLSYIIERITGVVLIGLSLKLLFG